MRYLLVLSLVWLQVQAPAADPARPADERFLQSAQEVARRLRAVAIDTPEGRTWPADVRDGSVLPTELGNGSAGVLLFWIQMHRAEPRGGYLDEVRRGADYLAAHLRTSIDPGAPGEWTTGLYGPIAGAGVALHEAYEVTGDVTHRAAALKCVTLLHGTVQRTPAGAAWNTSHDILTGAAGTGLFLLYAAERMGHEPSKALAIEVGRQLLARGVPDERGGLRWKGSYEARFVLPNFSHGTAGIGYFLAALHRASGDKAFLDGAIAAARYLAGVADAAEGGFRLSYGWPDPGWARPYDIGWAHGPAGTARLFQLLAAITGNDEWGRIADACARSLGASGIPGAPRPEYGPAFELNQRFGLAGVAHFFLDRYRASGDPSDLAFAERIADAVLAAGTRDGGGLTWRTKRAAFMEKAGQDAEFTSYFYGAAGYGLLMLDVAAARGGRPWILRLPDDPGPRDTGPARRYRP